MKKFKPIGMEHILDALNDLPQRLNVIPRGNAIGTQKKADGIGNGAQRLDEEQKSGNDVPDAESKNEKVQGSDDENDDEEEDANGHNDHESDAGKWTKDKIENMGFTVFMRDDYFYVVLTDHMEAFKSNYIFPVDENRPFMNLENQKVQYVGRDAKYFVYNINEKVFQLSLHIKAGFSENFENTDQEFPFEWQFLNMQFPYQLRINTLILRPN